MPAETLDSVREFLAAQVTTISHAEDVAPEEALVDLGVDSISVLTVLSQLAIRYEIDLADLGSVLEPPKTVNDMAQIINQLRTPS